MSKNYVKKHEGHDVPDGATHYGKAHGMYKACFYMTAEGRGLFFNPVLSTEWMVSGHGDIPPHATELPEQDLPNWDDQPKEGDVWIEFNQDGFSAGWYRREGDIYISRGGFVDVDVDCAEHELIVHKRPIAIEDKEWLPVVGEECEMRETSLITDCYEDWSRFTPEAFNTGSNGDPQIAGVDRNGDFAILYPSVDNTEFRPLKTAEEIDTEKVFDMLRGAIHPEDFNPREVASYLVRNKLIEIKGEG